MAPIALQLYTVRDLLQQDFAGTLARIAEIGYSGLETAGFPPGISAAQAADIFHSLDLAVVSAHSPLPIGKARHQVLETMQALDCKHLVSPWMDPQLYASAAGIRGVAAQFNQANQVARAHGLRFSIHNHWFEFEPVNGRRAYQILLPHLDADVLFEIDTYWVQTAGLDPAAIVAELGARAPLLHIKDGPAQRDVPMVALGQGVLDIPGIVAAGKPHTECLIVELDHCATDMMEAVRESYAYLEAAGLAE